MRKALLLSLSGLLWMFATLVAAKEQEFGQESSKGLFFKPVVGGEDTTYVLLPVNIEKDTFGTPIILQGRGDWKFDSTSNRSGITHHLYYVGHYLDPGDYAVLGWSAEIHQSVLDIHNWFCYARFSAVFSIRAGEVTFWRLMPIAVTAKTWPEHSEILRKRPDFEWFKQSADGIQRFHPTTIRYEPSAFVDLSGGLPVNVQACTPRSLEVVYRKEDLLKQSGAPSN